MRCLQTTLFVLFCAHWTGFEAAVAQQVDVLQVGDSSKAALDQVAPLDSVEAWKAALLEGEKALRRKTAIATLNLEASTQKRLVPVFIELLEKENDGQIRLAVFVTLTKLGPAAVAACPALANAMRQRFGGRYNEEVHQDYRAALTLASIGVEAVDTLRDLLGEEKANVRAEAAMALGRIGPQAYEAVPALVQLLADEEERVRIDARRALGAIGDRAGRALIEAAGSEDPVVRSNALLALKALATEDLELLNLIRSEVLRALRAENESVREAGVIALSGVRLTVTELQDRLLKQLDSHSKVVLQIVVQKFAERTELIDGVEAELAQLLLHGREEVAKAAANIFKFADAENVDLLLTAASDPRSRIDDLAECVASFGTTVRPELYACLEGGASRQVMCAAVALGMLRPVEERTPRELANRIATVGSDIQPFLVAGLAKLGPRARPAVPELRKLLTHADPKVRAQVLKILFVASERDQLLVDELTLALSDSSSLVQLEAIKALRSVGPEARSSIPQIIELLGTTENAVQKAAAEMIAGFTTDAEAAIPNLIQLLRSDQPDLQLASMKTLGEFGEVSQVAVPHIARLLEEGNPVLRAASLDALSKLDLELDALRPYLLTGLGDPELEVRDRAYSAIRRKREQAVKLLPELLPLLANENAAQTLPRLLDRLEEYTIDAKTADRLEELLSTLLDAEPSSLQSNENANESQPEALLATIKFLGHVEKPSAGLKSKLEALASHRDSRVAETAREALAD